MNRKVEAFCLDYARQRVSVETSFGLTPDDLDRVSDFIRLAEPNPNSSMFPDFLFEGGFIEHFQITSADENRKGSRHKKERSEFLKDIKESTNKASTEGNNEEIRVQHLSHQFDYPKHSYSNLIASFKKNWEHHINSLNNYVPTNNISQCGIFLVEYNEKALEMAEDILPDIDFDGISIGDFPCRPQVYSDYRLSRDVNMLDYLHAFKGQIEFVVYRYFDGIEIIKLINIPIIKGLMPWKYEICPAVVSEVCRTHIVSVPIGDVGGQ